MAFISVGSSIPKIGLHRAAARFRAAVERVANARAIFWGEYQTLTDVMNFYKVDPVTDMGLKGRSPVIRQVRVKAMLDPLLPPHQAQLVPSAQSIRERERPTGGLRLLYAAMRPPIG